MPGLVKVGYSSRNPTRRAKELGGTGVPYPYEVKFKLRVSDPQKVERDVHRDLAACRAGREWFRCAVPEAVEALKRQAAPHVIDEPKKESGQAKNTVSVHDWRRRESDRIEREKEALRVDFTHRLDSASGLPSTFLYIAGAAFILFFLVASAEVPIESAEAKMLILLLSVGLGVGLRAWHGGLRERRPEYQSLLNERDRAMNAMTMKTVECPNCKCKVRLPRLQTVRFVCPRCKRKALHLPHLQNVESARDT